MKILLVPFLLIGSSCSIDVDLGGDTIVGSGVERTDTFTFAAGVDGIDVGSIVDVRVIVDPGVTESTVILTGDDNVLDELRVRQDDDTIDIDIDTDGGVSFELSERPVAEITVASLVEVEAGGIAQVTVLDLGNADDLSLDASGGSRIEVRGEVGSLIADASGAALIRHEGAVSTAVVEASGGSIVELDGPVGSTAVDGSGGSTIRLATDEVTGELSGGSRLRLTEGAGRIDVDTSGGSLID